ncbi:MAG TPA: hypothetical protein VLA35_05730 [Thermoleophilia bacterium]|nr:hypothetical protein [Thermoleophilia bacterium]
MSDVLLACSDAVLAPALERLQLELGLTQADRLLIPGGPLLLARPGMERRVVLECLTTLVEGHGARRIVLVSHQQCSSYERALGGFGFDQQELLERDLLLVRTVIETAFPQVEVASYFIPWHEDNDVATFGEPIVVE